MMRTIGWYAGYLLALAHRDQAELSAGDRAVLDELSVLLQRLHAEHTPGKVPSSTAQIHSNE